MSESIRLKPGETVTIESWNNGLDFAREVVKEARRIGAHPLLILEDEEAYLSGLENAPVDSMGKMGAHEYNLLSSSNAYVFVPGPPIGLYSPMVSRDKVATATSYNSSWYETAEKSRVRAVRLSFGYIGRDLAEILGKSPSRIVDHLIRGSLASHDFRSVAAPIMNLLRDGGEARVGAGGGDLSFTLRGKLGLEDGVTDDEDLASGNNVSYIPGGMVSKGIDPSSANGTVEFSPSLTRLGVIRSGTLKFSGGRLTGWDSRDKKSKSALDLIFGDTPDEKRVLSLLTIGLNPSLQFGYAVDRFVRGSIGLGGFGFTAILRAATLKVGETAVVTKGKIREP